MTKEDKLLLYHQKVFGSLLFFRKDQRMATFPSSPYRRYLRIVGKKIVDSMSASFIKECIDQNGKNLKSKDTLWLAFF